MNKSELVAEISEIAGATKSAVQDVLDAIAQVVRKELKKEDARIDLSGIAILTTGIREERQGRHPRTGETIVIPRSKVVKFKAAKALKDAVNE